MTLAAVNNQSSSILMSVGSASLLKNKPSPILGSSDMMEHYSGGGGGKSFLGGNGNGKGD